MSRRWKRDVLLLLWYLEILDCLAEIKTSPRWALAQQIHRQSFIRNAFCYSTNILNPFMWTMGEWDFLKSWSAGRYLKLTALRCIGVRYQQLVKIKDEVSKGAAVSTSGGLTSKWAHEMLSGLSPGLNQTVWRHAGIHAGFFCVEALDISLQDWVLCFCQETPL